MLAAVCCLFMGGTRASAQADTDQGAAFERELAEWFSMDESRSAGRPANLRLVGDVSKRFAASGYEHGALRFLCPVLAPGYVTLSMPAGQTFHLEAMHPALLNPGNFSEAEFTTRLVYLGHGTYEDLEKLKGQPLDGAIAVMEYDCGREWMRLLRFGIRGLIFLGTEDALYEDSATKVYNTEVGTPRFYLPEERGDVLRTLLTAPTGQTTAEVRSVHSRWSLEELESPWVLIPGSDERLESQVVVFTAPLDANSVVPNRAVGAQSAPNLHLLMRLFDRFRQEQPQRSVLLVGVNAHTRRFLGERILAWNLLANRGDVSAMRDTISKELRIADLYCSNYSKLQLEGSDMDLDRLHVVMEMLWQLSAEQEARRQAQHDQRVEKRIEKIRELGKQDINLEDVELEPVPPVDHRLDLSEFDAEDYRKAVDAAVESLEKEQSGFLAMLSTDEEAIKGLQADIARLKSLRDMPFGDLRALAEQAKSTFEDERLLEKWRTALDKSTGVRLAIKSKLQNEASRVLNQHKLRMMSISIDDSLSEEERERRLEAMQDEKDNYTAVLKLFNKIDVGIGRSRTTYREVATNQTQLDILRGYVNSLLEQFREDVAQKQAALDRDTGNDAIRDAVGARRVQLVVNLDVNWNEPRVGFCTINSRVQNAWERELGELSDRVATERADQWEASDSLPYVSTMTGAGGRPQQHFFLNPHSPATVFHQADRTPAVALRSVYANADQAFGPDDTFDKLDMARCSAVSEWLDGYLAALVDHPDTVSAATETRVDCRDRIWASLIRTQKVDEFSAKTTPEQPVPYSLLGLYSLLPSPGETILQPLLRGGIINVYSTISDNAGQAVVYGIQETETISPVAFQMSEDFTEIQHVIDKGQIQSSGQMLSDIRPGTRSKTLPMFQCAEFPIYDRVDPSTLSAWPITVQEYWPMAASRKAEPRKYGTHGVAGMSVAAPPTLGPAAIYRWQRRKGLRNEPLLLLTNKKRGLLNPTPERPDGAGYQSAEKMGRDFFATASEDMDTLNRFRLKEMKGVSNQLIEEFLADGAEAIEDMKSAARNYDHNAFVQNSHRAIGNQAKAYEQIRGINADMLKAILMYMALMLPFCFFLQKLLFKFERIEHELLVFLGMFFGLYICFRFIHPAFAIAMSAEAIFIGFLLASIGLFTIWVLHTRFKGQMNMLFHNYTGMEAEVSYSTVGQTAMLIGVNNMKRRRLRTGLTTATIILVTFAMLAFSSVSKKMKPTIIAKDAEPPYSGLFFHWAGGNPMDEATAQVFRDLYTDRGDVLVRRIMTPPPVEEGASLNWQLHPFKPGANDIGIKGVVGLPMEDERFLGPFPLLRGDYFSAPDAREILLPASAAEGMGIDKEDVGSLDVRFLGQTLRLVGIVDDERYRLMRDLDPGFKLYPLKRESKSGGGGGQQDDGELEADRSTAIGIDTARLALLPAQFARRIGAKPFSISVRFRQDLDAQTNEVLWPELTRLLTATQAKVYIGSTIPFVIGEGKKQATTRGGTYYVGSSYRTSIGGFSRVLIPLIIAGTIILNTMLGTVYERKQEIAVYNAIGLNPTHIFMFFLGEAFVYSVIGSVSGYLIGQVLSIVLRAFNLVSAVNINFSSLMVVFAIMLTIGLVLLSTLYPASVATRTAVPSGKRIWSLPEHDGQTMQTVFPFIYQPNLALGVMYYIYEFFANFSEESIGELIAHLKDRHVGEDDHGRPVYRLVYEIALAPFDLGVTQTVTFTARFDEVVQSHRIHMRIDRISGQDSNWATTNKPFLEKLRGLLLRWRNLDSTQYQWYVEQAKSLYQLDGQNG